MNRSNTGDVDSRVRLNVGGVVFETTCDTLMRKPHTKLASLESIKTHKENKSGEVLDLFFDRNPDIFNCILDLYRTGQLHLPTNVCGATIRNELEFWEISRDNIEQCCLHTYYKYENDMKVFREIEASYQTSTDVIGKECFRKMIWRILQEPNSGWIAFIFSAIFMVMVLLSTAVLFLSTVPSLRVPIDTKDNNESQADSAIYIEHTVPCNVLRYIDMGCLIFFSAECLLTIFMYDRKTLFFSFPLNIIDVVSILSGWIDVAMIYSFRVWENIHALHVASRLLVILRILRLLRFFKLFRQFPAFRVIVFTIKSSLKQICMTFVFALLAVVFFAICTFYAEIQSDNATFTNAFEGLWWSLVTMTTLGYGDIVPKTVLGRIIGSILVISGLLILSMPIAIVTSNFNSYDYTNKDIMNHTKFNQSETLKKKFRAALHVVKVKPLQCKEVKQPQMCHKSA